MYGKRFTAEEALAAGIVDQVVSPETLLTTAVTFATNKTGTEGFDRNTLHDLKKGLYRDVIKAYEEESTEFTDAKTLSSKVFKKAKL